MNDDELPAIQVDVHEEGGRARAGRIPCEIGANLIFRTHNLAAYFFAKWEPVVFDLMLLAGFGLLGYLMRKLDYPSAPLILGLVLGGAMERALRQSLMMSEGSLTILVSRPISAVMLSFALVILLVPLFSRFNSWRLRALEQKDS